MNPQALVLQNLHGNTETSRKALESHGCYYDLCCGWVCPIESDVKVRKVIAEYKLKCELVIRSVLHDPVKMTPQQKKMKKMETRIDQLEKQIQNDENRLLEDVYQYDKGLRPSDFETPPTTEGKSDSQIRKEKDFHGRYLYLKQLKGDLDGLRHTWEQQQQNACSDDILVEQGKIHEAVDAAERLLREKDLGIYQWNGRLIRIVIVPKKRLPKSPLIIELDPASLVELLTRHANWLKSDSRNDSFLKSIDCPEKIPKILLAKKQWDIPVLTGVIQTPTLLSDGTILEKPGYDPESGLYLHLQEEFPPIPQNPSLEDAKVQLQIIKDLLSGFPFDGEESFSVALSAMLTALVRRSIKTAPLHGFTAPKMGTGKSLLADVVSLIATGKPNSVFPQADNEAEERKRMMAVLLDGNPIVCFDNIERPLESATLCSVLTQEEFGDRILGETRNMSASTRVTFLATGNNLVIRGDLSTRTILCRLDPKMERPEERSFNINLHHYLAEHRPKIAVALLTMLKAYHQAGRPKQNIKPYGRFEEWSNLIRSAIVWVGLADPCVSRKEIENSDPARMALINLLASWHELHGSNIIKVKDLILSADEGMGEKQEALKEALLEFAPDGKGGINERSLGKKLASYKNRIENGYRIEIAGNNQRALCWKVVKETR